MFGSAFRSTMIKAVGRFGAEQVTWGAAWAFPAAVGAIWFVWPFMDQEDLLYYKLTADPEAEIKMIHDQKMARLEAYRAAKGIKSSGASEKKVDDDNEEEEEAVAEEEEEGGGDEEESGGDEEESGGDEKESGGDEEEEGGGDEEEGSGGDDDDEEGDEEDDDDEPKIAKLGVFLPTKGDRLTLGEQWDNFTLKSIAYGDDEEDDEEDDDDEE